MKSRSTALLLCGTVMAIAILLILAAQRGMAQTVTSGTPAYITKAVADYQRFPQDVWLDPATKPTEVLAFIGVKPGDKVVDYLPGSKHIVAMYWTRLFYKVVGDTGRVYPYVPQVGCRANHLYPCMAERSLDGARIKRRPAETLSGDPRWNGIDEALDLAHTIPYRNLFTIWHEAGQFDTPEQVDVVWSTAHWGLLHGRDYQVNMPEFLSMVFDNMKNGGVLMIADYASNPNEGFTKVDTLHRSDKEAVKAEVTKAGFVFDGESTLWAKAGDNHIGVVPLESTPGAFDMFILKFRKPANAPPDARPTDAELAPFLVPGGVSDVESAVVGGQGRGSTWWNPDHTWEEYRSPVDADAPGNTEWGDWFVSARGRRCQRVEWPPIAEGLLVGCNAMPKETNLTPKHTWPPDPGPNAPTQMSERHDAILGVRQ